MEKTPIGNITQIPDVTKSGTPKNVEPVNLNKPVNSIKKEEIPENDLLDTKPQNVLQGIIWSEILGKPRSLRKGR